MNPNTFTIVLFHPEAKPVVLLHAPLDEITPTILGASPCSVAYAVPAQRAHATQDPEDIIRTTLPHIWAVARPGGYVVEATAPMKWTAKVVQALDYNEREARRLRKAELAAAALAADKAKERARAAQLPHRDCPELFALEQRARLVGA